MERENMINIKEDEKLSILNHSCAHLLAQAVQHLYPNAKFWVGPVISEGFYYDIDLGDKSINDEDLAKIENYNYFIQKEDSYAKPIDYINMLNNYFQKILNAKLKNIIQKIINKIKEPIGTFLKWLKKYQK